MDFRVISLPSFKAAVSGVDTICDFAENGILRKFDNFFSAIAPKEHESFAPRDFLYYDEEKKGLVWMWAITESGETGGFEVRNIEGGYYVTFVYKDGDDETHNRLYQEVLEQIRSSAIYELDIRQDHYAMGHIITPKEIFEKQGWGQMEVFVPIRMKK